ncbi:FMN-dependent dehydrogenase-domain-containing protein [Lipomyces arxii]|uniref:FMN-dependent dehydrogenase-domain-containing protein n=1 Tax=Lipomyces arxii TaxID=56418 RepID=UPI0034CDA3EC
MKTLDIAEVSAHKSAESCWVIINNNVYDVTKFLPDHPGGTRSILRLAGKDATSDFEAIHPPGTLEENLPESAKVGTVTMSQLETVVEKREEVKLAPESVEDMINIDDIVDHAKRTLSKRAWAYYASAADDSYSKGYNAKAFRKVLFRPRVLIDITKADTTSSILGVKTTLPVFVCPAALARLAHPDGEKAIARAAGKQGIVQMVSNNASLNYTDIVTAKIKPDQPFMFQLYVHSDRARSERLLKDIVKAGCRAVVLTVDSPTPGKRELDERNAREEARASGIVDDKTPLSATSGAGDESAPGGVGKALSAAITGDLVWSDVEWLRKQLPADVKIALKGLQTVEDVVIASDLKDKDGKKLVDGVVLSNHGGRSLNFSPPPLVLLEELRLYKPEVFRKLEICIDGGITRGTDVLKALCLGATQVGIGRPALFGLAGGFGEAGVDRAIQILRGEIDTSMRLLGVTSLRQLGPQYVNTRQLDQLLGPTPEEALASAKKFKSKL